MKSQYYIKVKYNHDGHECQELTEDEFANENAVREAYEARGKSLHFKIVEVTAEEN